MPDELRRERSRTQTLETDEAMRSRIAAMSRAETKKVLISCSKSNSFHDLASGGLTSSPFTGTTRAR
jgi:hypothetical protein